jgi:hypothetical protein
MNTNTKNEILKVLPNDIFNEIINQINFVNLDNFVNNLISGYVSKRGVEVVKREIKNDSQSDTSNFLTHIIEVGSLIIIQESNLLSNNIDNNEITTVAVSLSLNISIATSLKSLDLFDLDTIVYYAFDALETLFPRILNHINNSLYDNNYINGLKNNYLLSKI